MASSQQLSMNLNLGITPETKDKELFSETIKLYNAVKIIAAYLDAYTGNTFIPTDQMQDTGFSTILTQHTAKAYVEFDTDVIAGALVNVYDSAGVLHARFANATDDTKPARAFVPRAVAAGDFGEIAFLGLCTSISGLTPGALYYLAKTDGNLTAAAPAVAGNLVQPVGFALSTGKLWFNPDILGKTV